jgi:hypothetical protein
MAMEAFVCPECQLETRPAACFFSRGKTWWSVSPAEAVSYRQRCRRPELWPGGTILGCESLRVTIDPWLHAGRSVDDGGGSGTPDEISIAEVAINSVVVEPQADVAVAFPPELGDSFRDPEIRAAFECNPGTAEVRAYELTNVVFDAARLLLYSNGRRIAETRYLLDANYYREPLDPRRGTRELDTTETVVIGANQAAANYYHWLMQSLPAIDHSLRMLGAENCILALPPLAPFQEESLALLGYADVPRVTLERHTLYRFRRAVYCGYLHGAAEDFLSPSCLGVLERLAGGVEPIPPAFERLYISRLDSNQRVVRNESDVRRMMESFGFCTLVLGLLPLRTQIGLFRGAQIVVGVHGAGMANLAFCRPGTTVLELIQSTYPVLFMNRIAQARGLRYHAECFECEAGDDVHQQAWDVDLDLLETKLRRLL